MTAVIPAPVNRPANLLEVSLSRRPPCLVAHHEPEGFRHEFHPAGRNRARPPRRPTTSLNQVDCVRCLDNCFSSGEDQSTDHQVIVDGPRPASLIGGSETVGRRHSELFTDVHVDEGRDTGLLCTLESGADLGRLVYQLSVSAQPFDHLVIRTDSEIRRRPCDRDTTSDERS